MLDQASTERIPLPNSHTGQLLFVILRSGIPLT